MLQTLETPNIDKNREIYHPKNTEYKIILVFVHTKHYLKLKKNTNTVIYFLENITFF